MAVVAYLLPPLTGLVAYLFGGDARARCHGLQSVLFGALWPAALYVCSWIAVGATQMVAATGAILWVIFVLATAMGKDPGVPLVAAWLRRAAETSPRATDEV